jgi:hypothetical protein
MIYRYRVLPYQVIANAKSVFMTRKGGLEWGNTDTLPMCTYGYTFQTTLLRFLEKYGRCIVLQCLVPYRTYMIKTMYALNLS